MKTLQDQGVDVFLEVGPAPVLLGMGRQCVPEDSAVWLPSLRRGHNDWKQMLGSLAQLYVRGQNIDWIGYEAGRKRRRLAASWRVVFSSGGLIQACGGKTGGCGVPRTKRSG